MRSFDHVKQMAIALALGLSLASCDSLSDLENIFNNKKPLPGERKPVFSDGVPGVPQGIPPELVRGYQTPVDVQQPAAVATPAEKPVAEPAEKPKPKPRPTTVAVPAGPPATSITVGPKGSNTPAAGASAWPAPPAAGQQPQQQQANPSPPQWPPSSAQSAPPAPSPWPAAPPPGTFSR